jgi:hypothetical protein
LAAEVAAGLGLYFNKALGNNLLYRFERGQYADQLKKLQKTDQQLSSVYGAEHLLRLFGESMGKTDRALARCRAMRQRELTGVGLAIMQ